MASQKRLHDGDWLFLDRLKCGEIAVHHCQPYANKVEGVQNRPLQSKRGEEHLEYPNEDSVPSRIRGLLLQVWVPVRLHQAGKITSQAAAFAEKKDRHHLRRSYAVCDALLIVFGNLVQVHQIERQPRRLCWLSGKNLFFQLAAPWIAVTDYFLL